MQPGALQCGDGSNQQPQGRGVEEMASVFWEGCFNLRFCLDLIYNNCKHALAVVKHPGLGILHGAATIGDTGSCTRRAPAAEMEGDCCS